MVFRAERCRSAAAVLASRCPFRRLRVGARACARSAASASVFMAFALGGVRLGLAPARRLALRALLRLALRLGRALALACEGVVARPQLGEERFQRCARRLARARPLSSIFVAERAERVVVLVAGGGGVEPRAVDVREAGSERRVVRGLLYFADDALPRPLARRLARLGLVPARLGLALRASAASPPLLPSMACATRAPRSCRREEPLTTRTAPACVV